MPPPIQQHGQRRSANEATMRTLRLDHAAQSAPELLRNFASRRSVLFAHSNQNETPVFVQIPPNRREPLFEIQWDNDIILAPQRFVDPGVPQVLPQRSVAEKEASGRRWVGKSPCLAVDALPHDRFDTSLREVRFSFSLVC